MNFNGVFITKEILNKRSKVMTWSPIKQSVTTTYNIRLKLCCIS